MEIGKPIRKITVIPLDQPIPETPALPAPKKVPTPERLPEKIPA